MDLHVFWCYLHFSDSISIPLLSYTYNIMTIYTMRLHYIVTIFFDTPDHLEPSYIMLYVDQMRSIDEYVCTFYGEIV